MSTISPSGDVAPLGRCCPRHEDWPTLAEHLVADFPNASERDVLQELARAKSAVASFGMSDSEQLSVAELMARHQLLITTGKVADIARLDPERHVRSDPSA